jgi:hypothetical protein
MRGICCAITRRSVTCGQGLNGSALAQARGKPESETSRTFERARAYLRQRLLEAGCGPTPEGDRAADLANPSARPAWLTVALGGSRTAAICAGISGELVSNPSENKLIGARLPILRGDLFGGDFSSA